MQKWPSFSLRSALAKKDSQAATKKYPASEKDGDEMNCNHEGEYSWLEHDARGIPLAKVCAKCKEAKLAVYRPEVLTDPQYDTFGEQIEEDI